eukprot:7790584-Lingulodinium_polyedra.AAC.1
MDSGLLAPSPAWRVACISRRLATSRARCREGWGPQARPASAAAAAEPWAAATEHRGALALLQ